MRASHATGRLRAPPSPRGRAAAAALFLALAAGPSGAVVYQDTFSAWNAARPRRASTDLIVLHTTEAPTRSSLNKLRTNGEAHFLVSPGGTVYRIIERRRVAMHAGRSMWNGRTSLDDTSIGVEVVGYHDRDITDAQVLALRGLLDDLQRFFRIPDERVLTHSMVAYGSPNQWVRKSHRGRKRCGMCFAKPTLRARLGLTAAPRSDPDVAAGRLIVGDAYLAKMLYGWPPSAAPAVVAAAPPPAPPASAAPPAAPAVAAVSTPPGNVIGPGQSAWDIARDRYRSAAVTYVYPDGRRQRGDQVTAWKSIPAGTRVLDSGAGPENELEGLRVIGRDGASATEVAGDEDGASTTYYFRPDGATLRGSDLTPARRAALPQGTRVLVGYGVAGTVTRTRAAFDICGAQWCSREAFYRCPDGALRSGDAIDPKSIRPGTVIYVPL